MILGKKGTLNTLDTPVCVPRFVEMGWEGGRQLGSCGVRSGVPSGLIKGAAVLHMYLCVLRGSSSGLCLLCYLLITRNGTAQPLRDSVILA